MISDPGLWFKVVPPKAMTENKIKSLRKGVALQFILNCSPWFPVHLCPFMLSIVSKMVNVSTFMSTTLDQTDPKRTFATLFASCMSGGNIPKQDVRHQVMYRCHLSCQA